MKKTYVLQHRDLKKITKMLRRLELTVAEAILICESTRAVTSKKTKPRPHHNLALTEDQLDLIRWQRNHSDAYDEGPGNL